MEIIKCPRCGESDLKEINPGEYRCSVCGSVLKENKVQEILDILKSNPEKYKGNIKHRINIELEKELLDLDVIYSLCDRILDEDPEDPYYTFLSLYCRRRKDRISYKNYILTLGNLELPEFVKNLIASFLINHYEGQYRNEIVTYLNKQDLYEDYKNELNNKILKSTDEIDLKDPCIKRDIYIISDPEDFNNAARLVKVLEDNGMTCYFEPVNFDYDMDREEQILEASKNTKLTIIINSSNFKNNKDMRFETNKIINATIDNDLEKYNLNRTILFNIEDDALCDNRYKDFTSYNINETNEYMLADTVKQLLFKMTHKEDYIGEARLEEAIELRKDSHYKKALHEFMDLLNEDFDNEHEALVRIEILRCFAGLDELYCDDAFAQLRHLKKLMSNDELEKLEEELPILVDEEKAYQEGIKFFAKKEYSEAKKYFEKASKKNYPLAYNKLGEMYLSGKGVNQDINEAIAYFEKAELLGCDDADRMLGMMYLIGNKVTKDEYKAFKYLKKGADNHNAFCAFKVALCYQDGVGTVIDLVKCFEYLKIAAQAEIVDACFLLGKCYKYGKGTSINHDYAQKCFEYAARNGNIEAKFELMGH